MKTGSSPTTQGGARRLGQRRSTDPEFVVSRARSSSLGCLPPCEAELHALAPCTFPAQSMSHALAVSQLPGPTGSRAEPPAASQTHQQGSCTPMVAIGHHLGPSGSQHGSIPDGITRHHCEDVGEKELSVHRAALCSPTACT